MGKMGVSVVIQETDKIEHLSRFLESFIKINTYNPIEIIICRRCIDDNIFKLIANYTKHALVRLIPKNDGRYRFSSASNNAAKRANYPILLFLDSNILYTSDLIPLSIKLLFENKNIGVIGSRIEDGVLNSQKVGHAGIDFEWDKETQLCWPVPNRYDNLAPHFRLKNDFSPAVTKDFMLCYRSDFQTLKGFWEGYDEEYEDIDFCLRMGRDLHKRCYCIREMGLQCGDVVTQRSGGNGENKKNVDLFNKRLGKYVGIFRKRNERVHDHKKSDGRITTITSGKKINILFVLYHNLETNGGIHAQLHSEYLMKYYHRYDCLFAVPDDSQVSRVTEIPNNKCDRRVISREFNFSSILSNGVRFSNGRGPDIVHVWTPREIVRVFCGKLLEKYSVPLIVHLEDNEEYLTEISLNRNFGELSEMSHNELDKLISGNRYHPLRGREFLFRAQGVTMIIDTLARFNYADVPSMVLPAPVDEKLFYPRPLNMAFRDEMKIPKHYMVIAYTGNFHIGNRNEVRALYKAVHLLNNHGYPTVLLRTGIDAIELGTESWLRDHVKYLGWMKREQIPKVLAAADILVQPGKPGPFNDQRLPSKLYEFFAMGRPVILPHTNGGRHVKHLHEGFILENADAAAIVESVKKIKGDNDLAMRLSHGSVNFYLRQRTSRLHYSRLDSFYDSIICSKSNGHTTLKLTATTAHKGKNVLSKKDMTKLAEAQSVNSVGWDDKKELTESFFSKNSFVFRNHLEEYYADIQNALGSDVVVVPCLERALETNSLPTAKPWIGFVHTGPMNIPEWLINISPYRNVLDIQNSFKQCFEIKDDVKKKGEADDLNIKGAFELHKSMCRGLFLQSFEHAARVRSIVDVPVSQFSPPLPENSRKWSWSAYHENPDKKVIQVGWWMQRIHAIHVLPVQKMRKIWIRNTNNDLDVISMSESQNLKSRHILFDFMLETVTNVDMDGVGNYDDLLDKNIVFAHLYDSNSLNLIFDCIIRHTPILINPHAAICEYLGNDYPLYYYSYNDAAKKIENFSLLLQAHKHLQMVARRYMGTSTEAIVQKINNALFERCRK